MRRQKRRPMHYTSISFHDGTIIAAHPNRKPTHRTIKRDKLRTDEDGVCHDFSVTVKEFSDIKDESRFRFQNIITNRLNTRRAIREIVIPELAQLKEAIDAIHNQLNQIQELLADK